MLIMEIMVTWTWLRTRKVPKSLLSKRDSEVLDVIDDSPLKRKRLTFIDEDDVDWLKREVSEIKESIRNLREHMDNKLEELLLDVQQLELS